MKRIVIIVAVLVLIGGAGLFILDRTIFAPTDVSTQAPAAPALSSSDPSAHLYRIDAAQSEVRYEVGETLVRGNTFRVAVGRTKGVSGDILVDLNEPSNSRIGAIVIDVSQFTSDESRRDNFIRRTGLESSRYPTATFVTKSIDGLPTQVKVGDQISFTISGDLTVKQTTKPVTWQVTMKLEDSRLVGSASTQLTMSEFGVGPIQIPLLSTEDAVKLSFDFVASPVTG